MAFAISMIVAAILLAVFIPLGIKVIETVEEFEPSEELHELRLRKLDSYLTPEDIKWFEDHGYKREQGN